MQWVEDLEVLADSLSRLAGLDTEMWHDIGPHLTCYEADTFADLLKAIGEHETMKTILAAHASSDVEGDDHYGYLA
jgi:hypothetical protein